MKHKRYFLLLVILAFFSAGSGMGAPGSCDCSGEESAPVGLDSAISYKTVETNKQTLSVDIKCDASVSNQDACEGKELCAKASWFAKENASWFDEEDANTPKLDQVTTCFMLGDSKWESQGDYVYRRTISITSSKAVLPEAKTAIIRLSLPEQDEDLVIFGGQGNEWDSVTIE